MPAYSSTPLPKKLGIKAGNKLLILGAPMDYVELLGELPDIEFLHDTAEAGVEYDFIHAFVRTHDELATRYSIGYEHLAKSGMLWLSWPKKSSSLTTELDKETIRLYGLEHGLVDVKVCSVDDDWSGHKFVYRKEDR